MSIFEILSEMSRLIIEPPVIKLSDNQSHFDQHTIPLYYISNQDLLAPIEETFTNQGILNIDNPVTVDSEQDRLEYLYDQQGEIKDTEDVLEECEVPPIRLVNLS